MFNPQQLEAFVLLEIIRGNKRKRSGNAPFSKLQSERKGVNMRYSLNQPKRASFYNMTLLKKFFQGKPQPSQPHRNPLASLANQRCARFTTHSPIQKEQDY